LVHLAHSQSSPYNKKKERLKFIKVAYANLSLILWLALEGWKSCASVKIAEGSNPLGVNWNEWITGQLQVFSKHLKL